MPRIEATCAKIIQYPTRVVGACTEQGGTWYRSRRRGVRRRGGRGRGRPYAWINMMIMTEGTGRSNKRTGSRSHIRYGTRGCAHGTARSPSTVWAYVGGSDRCASQETTTTASIDHHDTGRPRLAPHVEILNIATLSGPILPEDPSMQSMKP